MAKMFTAMSRAVGNNKQDQFKVEDKKKKRFALIPTDIYPHELEITPELIERAKMTNNEGVVARERIEELKAMKADILEGLKDGSSEVFQASDRKVEGYLYPPILGDNIAYIKDKGYFAIKEEWLEELGDLVDPKPRYICVVLEYAVDDQTGVAKEVHPDRQRTASDGVTKIPFSYELRYFTLSQSSITDWKSTWTEFKPLNSDYFMVGEKQKNYVVPKYSNASKCLWRSLGPVVVDDIVREARKMYKEAPKKLCRTMDLDALKKELGFEETENQSIPTAEEREEATTKFMG